MESLWKVNVFSNQTSLKVSVHDSSVRNEQSDTNMYSYVIVNVNVDVDEHVNVYVYYVCI